MYRQCLLIRGDCKQVAWIPAILARVGKYVRIRSVDGWLVEAAWGIGEYGFKTGDGRGYRSDFNSLGA